MTAPLRSRRRSVRAVEHVHHAAPKPSLLMTAGRIAFSKPARIAYVMAGAAGLAALTVVVIGPKRLERNVLRPLRGAVEPQAEKLWSDSRQLRDQIAGLLRNTAPASRARLAKNLQSWIGHFHAT